MDELFPLEIQALCISYLDVQFILQLGKNGLVSRHVVTCFSERVLFSELSHVYLLYPNLSQFYEVVVGKELNGVSFPLPEGGKREGKKKITCNYLSYPFFFSSLFPEKKNFVWDAWMKEKNNENEEKEAPNAEQNKVLAEVLHFFRVSADFAQRRVVHFRFSGRGNVPAEALYDSFQLGLDNENSLFLAGKLQIEEVRKREQIKGINFFLRNVIRELNIYRVNITLSNREVLTEILGPRNFPYQGRLTTLIFSSRKVPSGEGFPQRTGELARPRKYPHEILDPPSPEICGAYVFSEKMFWKEMYDWYAKEQKKGEKKEKRDEREKEKREEGEEGEEGENEGARENREEREKEQKKDENEERLAAAVEEMKVIWHQRRVKYHLAEKINQEQENSFRADQEKPEKMVLYYESDGRISPVLPFRGFPTLIYEDEGAGSFVKGRSFPEVKELQLVFAKEKNFLLALDLFPNVTIFHCQRNLIHTVCEKIVLFSQRKDFKRIFHVYEALLVDISGIPEVLQKQIVLHEETAKESL